MSEILSQDEVNALLQGVGDGSVPLAEEKPAAARAGSAVPLDLTSQERALRGRLPGLELVLDRFTRDVRGSLGTFFGQIPTVEVTGVNLQKFGGIVAALERPVSLQLFDLAPLPGQGLLVVAPSLIEMLLQVFFGGEPARKTRLPARELSPIEQRVVERLGARVLADLRAAWRPTETIACTFVASETNPQFAAICGAEELVIATGLRVSVEGCGSGTLSVCLPNAALDPIRARLQRLPVSGGGRTTPEEWRARLEVALADAAVEVSAELGGRRMALREVLALGVGDLVTLGTGRDGPVVLRVGGKPRFLGAPGVAGGKNAVRITARA
ncbi:MAG TPA: flagellar motor switch protein FliM [Candidatus Binatia bacterium]|nr:flagellar motor switch protein FliM [Candidatus Binatia bacterium]